MKQLVNVVEDLKDRDVGFKVFVGHGAQIDTITSNGRLVFGIFVALAEFERDLIAERTRAGLATMRARGRLGGRSRKMDRATIKMAMVAMADRNFVANEVVFDINYFCPSASITLAGFLSPKWWCATTM